VSGMGCRGVSGPAGRVFSDGPLGGIRPAFDAHAQQVIVVLRRGCVAWGTEGVVGASSKGVETGMATGPRRQAS
jgi:hypothetical protein